MQRASSNGNWIHGRALNWTSCHQTDLSREHLLLFFVFCNRILVIVVIATVGGMKAVRASFSGFRRLQTFVFTVHSHMRLNRHWDWTAAQWKWVRKWMKSGGCELTWQARQISVCLSVCSTMCLLASSHCSHCSHCDTDWLHRDGTEPTQRIRGD